MTGVLSAAVAAKISFPVEHIYTSGSGVAEPVPAGATQVRIRVYGGGGSGSSGIPNNWSGGGGGGGGFCLRNAACAGGNTLTFTVSPARLGVERIGNADGRRPDQHDRKRRRKRNRGSAQAEEPPPAERRIRPARTALQDRRSASIP